MRKIEAEFQELKSKVQFLEAFLRNIGFTGEWVSISQAADMLGLKPRFILTVIHKAESSRILKNKHGLKYGVHYRNIAEAAASKPTWQVHYSAFQDWLNTPPETRD